MELHGDVWIVNVQTEKCYRYDTVADAIEDVKADANPDNWRIALQLNLRMQDDPSVDNRCDYIERDKSQGKKVYRRCTRVKGHEAQGKKCAMSSWCIE